MPIPLSSMPINSAMLRADLYWAVVSGSDETSVDDEAADEEDELEARRAHAFRLSFDISSDSLLDEDDLRDELPLLLLLLLRLLPVGDSSRVMPNGMCGGSEVVFAGRMGMNPGSTPPNDGGFLACPPCLRS